MSVELEDRIRDALAWRADGTTITAGTTFDGRPPTPDERDPTRLRVALSAAAALLLAGTGAFAVAITSRGGPEPLDVGGPPVETVRAAVEESADDGTGRVGLPAGSTWEITDAGMYLPADAIAGYPWRVYATDASEPETAEAFIVAAYEDIVGPPGPNPEPVTVQGVEGDLGEGSGGSRQLVFFVDGYVYTVMGFNVTDAELVRAAESARPSPDGNGAVLASAALPDGVHEQLVGAHEDPWFTSMASARQPAARLHLQYEAIDATYLSLADQRIARLNRLLFDEVAPVGINGIEGFVGSMEHSEFTAVVWTTDGRTNVIYAVAAVESELVDLARSLRTVSEEEWMEMHEATRRP